MTSLNINKNNAIKVPVDSVDSVPVIKIIQSSYLSLGKV